jgi:hypothetical protein
MLLEPRERFGSVRLRAKVLGSFLEGTDLWWPEIG